MRCFRAVPVALLLQASTAAAGMTPADLSAVGVAPPANAQIPVAAVWQDENDNEVRLGIVVRQRPTVLLFADFTCTSLCSPMLSTVSGLLAEMKLKPGRDYNVLVLGLDPKDSAADASAMRSQIRDSAVAATTSFLRADRQHISAAAAAVGYRFVFDSEHDQFAHPAALLVLNTEGKVTRVLAGLGLSAADLRLALVEAGAGKVGAYGDLVQLMCYGFDPALGIYTARVNSALMLASALTVVLVAVMLAMLARRNVR